MSLSFPPLSKVFCLGVFYLSIFTSFHYISSPKKKKEKKKKKKKSKSKKHKKKNGEKERRCLIIL